ncbi:MAG: DUF2796 domain-containing protein [Pseudohongiellaceae bacterium]
MRCHARNLHTIPILLTAFGFSLGDVVVNAQGLDSHVHGIAELNIAMIDQQIQLEFISPAMNLLGFERAPSSAKEKALWEKIISDLQTNRWLLGDAFGDCRKTTLSFEAPDYAETLSHEHHNHEGESHGDIRVQYQIDCPNKPAKDLSIAAFSSFSGLNRINVQWVTESQQGFAVLNPSNIKLTLE